MIDETPKTDGVVKFDIPDVICECITIAKVTLRLYAIDPSRGGGFVHVMNPTWDEDGIDWSNAPESSGPPLVKIGPAANETWIEADVTGYDCSSVAIRLDLESSH